MIRTLNNLSRTIPAVFTQFVACACVLMFTLASRFRLKKAILLIVTHLYHLVWLLVACSIYVAAMIVLMVLPILSRFNGQSGSLIAASPTHFLKDKFSGQVLLYKEH